MKSELIKLENAIVSFFKSYGWIIKKTEANSRKFECCEIEYNDLFTEYKSDKLNFIKRENRESREKYGLRINHIEFVPNNKVFQSIVKNIQVFAENYSLDLNFHYSVFCSLVNEKLYIHNALTIYLPNKSALIRICPSNTGIVISNISVHSNYRNLKLGYVLMCLLFRCILLSKNEIPPIYLECTGNVTRGNRFISFSISKQAKFFRKFGFRVTLNKKKNYELSYIKMEFQNDKLDIQSLVYNFPNCLIQNENNHNNLTSEFDEGLGVAA
jgi:hypothetical protein